MKDSDSCTDRDKLWWSYLDMLIKRYSYNILCR